MKKTEIYENSQPSTGVSYYSLSLILSIYIRLGGACSSLTGPRYMAGDYGVFSTAGSSYANNANCSWLIESSAGLTGVSPCWRYNFIVFSADKFATVVCTNWLSDQIRSSIALQSWCVCHLNLTELQLNSITAWQASIFVANNAELITYDSFKHDREVFFRDTNCGRKEKLWLRLNYVLFILY